MKKYFILALILTLSVSILMATEFHVGPVGSGHPYSTISAAIEDADDGDIITVHEGEYVENLEIDNKSLTLRSSDWDSGIWNPEDFIINGDYNGHVIDIYSGDHVIIQGFTIKNSGTNYTSVPGLFPDIKDSGIFSIYTGTLEIQQNEFINNYCGIYIKGIINKAEISSNTFNNLISNYAFPRYITWNAHEDLIVKNNTFYKTNSVYIHGPIECYYGNVEFLNNELSIYNSSIFDLRTSLNSTAITNISKNDFNLSGSCKVVSTVNTDLIMNSNSIIYEEGATGTAIQLFSMSSRTSYFTENLIVGGTTGFWFEDRASGNAATQGFFRNNTILSCGTAFYFEDTNLSGANGIAEFKNNIVWDVNNSFYFEDELDTPITIEYSCIEGGVPNDPSIINGVGNIDINPDLTPDYHLSEDSILLIDHADPDTNGNDVDWQYDEDDRDIDGSRKDMGCYPYLHDYDTKVFTKGVHWVSFPVLTPDGTYEPDPPNNIPSIPPIDYELYQQAYEVNNTAGLLQDETGAGTIDEFIEILGNRYGTPMKIRPQGAEFELHDDYFENMLFRHEGYKIEIGSTTDPTELKVGNGVGDERLPVNYEISGSMVTDEYHWIGYWIPRTQSMIESFGDFWQKVKKVKSEDWFYSPAIIQRGEEPDPNYPIALSAEHLTLEYGKAYLVLFNEQIEDFRWTDSSITVEAEKKSEPESFTYTEKADYEAIDVFNIPPNVSEIGVFEDDICVGAVVVEDTCAQILVYSDNANRNPIPFTFEVVTGRGFSSPIKNYQVMNMETGKYETKSIFSSRQEYSVMRFSDEEELEDNILSTPQLHGNYPNPFNPTTTISFSLPDEQEIDLTIYNIKGQKVKRLIDGQLTSGQHSIIWEGKDTNGKSVSTGIYFYRLKTGKKELSRKMLLLK